MTILAYKIEVPFAENITITKDTLSVDLSDGRTISVPLAGSHGFCIPRRKREIIGGSSVRGTVFTGKK